MKLSKSILSVFLLTQTASAFTSPIHATKTTSSLRSTAVAEPSTSSSTTTDRLSDVKYETDVNVEQKFKVAEVDKTILDPKKRVQT